MKIFRLIITFYFILLVSSGCTNFKSLETINISANESHTLVIGHRGARSLAPENTLASARKAFALGADMWEMDVAVTADQELVVLHDDSLDRTCNAQELYPGRVPWKVWEFTLQELKTLDCGSWFVRTDPFGQLKAGAVTPQEAESYKGEPIPTLREALEFTRDNHWRINVELKDQPKDELGQIIVNKTVALINELGMDDGEQVVISSFNHDYLKAVHELNPKIPVQVLTTIKIKDLAQYLTSIGSNACNPKLDTWSIHDMAEFSANGIQINVWTVNDEAAMKLLMEAQIHGIITDYPQRLILLQQKTQ